jgi:hypothetical protein
MKLAVIGLGCADTVTRISMESRGDGKGFRR